MRRGAGGPDDLLIQIATWFYVQGRSQVRIARELGLDPSTVSRYLKRARAEGIVQVTITRPSRERTDLARKLAQAHGLARVIVVEAADDALGRVCAATAEHVEQHLVMGMHLGLSWGRTVAAVWPTCVGSVAGLESSPSSPAGSMHDARDPGARHACARRSRHTPAASRGTSMHRPSSTSAWRTR